MLSLLPLLLLAASGTSQELLPLATLCPPSLFFSPLFSSRRLLRRQWLFWTALTFLLLSFSPSFLPCSFGGRARHGAP